MSVKILHLPDMTYIAADSEAGFRLSRTRWEKKSGVTAISSH